MTASMTFNLKDAGRASIEALDLIGQHRAWWLLTENDLELTTRYRPAARYTQPIDAGTS